MTIYALLFNDWLVKCENMRLFSALRSLIVLASLCLSLSHFLRLEISEILSKQGIHVKKYGIQEIA